MLPPTSITLEQYLFEGILCPRTPIQRSTPFQFPYGVILIDENISDNRRYRDAGAIIFIGQARESIHPKFEGPIAFLNTCSNVSKIV